MKSILMKLIIGVVTLMIVDVSAPVMALNFRDLPYRDYAGNPITYTVTSNRTISAIVLTEDGPGIPKKIGKADLRVKLLPVKSQKLPRHNVRGRPIKYSLSEDGTVIAKTLNDHIEGKKKRIGKIIRSGWSIFIDLFPISYKDLPQYDTKGNRVAYLISKNGKVIMQVFRDGTLIKQGRIGSIYGDCEIINE